MEAVAIRRPLRQLAPAGTELASVVLASVVLVLAGFAMFGPAKGAIGLVLFPSLAALTSIDLRHHLLPNAIVLPAAAAALLAAAADPSTFLDHLWAGLALGGFLFVFAAIFPGGLGMGDAKLGLLIGFALGGATMTAMFYALFTLFIAAGWILVRGGADARRTMIAFGPFLAFGASMAFFTG